MYNQPDVQGMGVPYEQGMGGDIYQDPNAPIGEWECTCVYVEMSECVCVN